MNDVQAAMDAFSKDDEVAQVSPLFPTAEKELLEDLRDQYLAANAKLKGKNTLRQKGEGETEDCIATYADAVDTIDEAMAEARSRVTW